MKVIVVGAGPAGMMSAIKAAENGAEVIILEKMKKPGRKMMITGKGRCNITNAADVPDIIKNIRGNGKFLYSAIRAFDNQAVINFFEENGVATKVERGGRVFPKSDKAKDAVDAMVHRLHELKVKLECDKKVAAILLSDRHAAGVRLADGTIYKSDAVILAVGGASYPTTGSAGDGYEMVQKVGHKTTTILPSLVPLVTEEEWVQDVQGLALKNVSVTLMADGERQEEMFGEMLFTHFGVSGPIILSLSRTAAILLAAGKLVEIVINLKPALSKEQLDARIQRDFNLYQRKQLANALVDLLPHKLINPVLDYAYLDGNKFINQVTAKERARLVDALQGLTLVIAKTRPIAEAIVTNGGIDVKEINPKTMESKLIKGLYFAGEVADVDAYTGGYNLQIAFSMGAAAGNWCVWNES